MVSRTCFLVDIQEGKTGEHYVDIPIVVKISLSTVLGSGVVSTALQCGAGRCPTDNLTLSTPVRITIEHSEENKVQTCHVSTVQKVLLVDKISRMCVLGVSGGRFHPEQRAMV